jgi:hypothetical protein
MIARRMTTGRRQVLKGSGALAALALAAAMVARRRR